MCTFNSNQSPIEFSSKLALYLFKTEIFGMNCVTSVLFYLFYIKNMPADKFIAHAILIIQISVKIGCSFAFLGSGNY